MKLETIMRWNGGWYECAPYGEQTPKDLPALLLAFVSKYAGLREESEVEKVLDSAEGDDPVWLLFDCIFQCGAMYAGNQLDWAVCQGNNEILKEIGLRQENGVYTRCPEPTEVGTPTAAAVVGCRKCASPYHDSDVAADWKCENLCKAYAKPKMVVTFWCDECAKPFLKEKVDKMKRWTRITSTEAAKACTPNSATEPTKVGTPTDAGGLAVSEGWPIDLH
jgi:hypothetical protein